MNCNSCMKHLKAQGSVWRLTLVSVCREGSVRSAEAASGQMERWTCVLQQENVEGMKDGNDRQLDHEEVSAWVSLALCAVHIDTIKPPQSLEPKTQLRTCCLCHFCGKRSWKNILIFTLSQNSLPWCRWLWRRCFEVAKVSWVMFILRHLCVIVAFALY